MVEPADRTRILVTGAKGQLGMDVVKVLSPSHDVTGVDVAELDIRQKDAVEVLVRETAPRVVVHAAAYTDVDGCESDHETAIAVNRDGTRYVAAACRETGARLIYISTDYVFDGEKDSAYHEDDPAHPKTVYGMSKLAGEKAVWEEISDFVILRIAWLYGKHGKNFVRAMLKLAQQQISAKLQGHLVTPLKVVNDQFGSPTWSMEVARQIEAILTSDIRGVCHATGQGEVSWYDFATDIFAINKLKVLVLPCTTEEFPRPAPRPRRSTLDNRRLREAGLDVMRPYREALEEFLTQGATTSQQE
ncbi:dTDP-4-dehydrorhamnose reductase [candidate division GN15 bacterium]|nr:dTDP-4-dehydrorhamnose reductase [candidate division GN15 bacterium]